MAGWITVVQYRQEHDEIVEHGYAVSSFVLAHSVEETLRDETGSIVGRLPATLIRDSDMDQLRVLAPLCDVVAAMNRGSGEIGRAGAIAMQEHWRKRNGVVAPRASDAARLPAREALLVAALKAATESEQSAISQPPAPVTAMPEAYAAKYLGLSDSQLLEYCADDAQKWAEAFCAHAAKYYSIKLDEGWTLGWFANAIEHSTDVRARRTKSPFPSDSYVLFKDGDRWCATRLDFVNLVESRAGFGATENAAIDALEREENKAAYPAEDIAIVQRPVPVQDESGSSGVEINGAPELLGYKGKEFRAMSSLYVASPIAPGQRDAIDLVRAKTIITGVEYAARSSNVAIILASPGVADVLQDVFAERTSQDAQWGGPEHDDKHTQLEWIEFISKQIGKWHRDDAVSFRDRMTKIAALAMAALESDARIALRKKEAVKQGRASLSPLPKPTINDDGTASFPAELLGQMLQNKTLHDSVLAEVRAEIARREKADNDSNNNGD